MVKLRDHEKMKELWPPKFEGPHGFWDQEHPGEEWGDLIQVKWVEPNRKGEQPFVKLIVHWDNVDFRSVICSEDTAFLKRLCKSWRGGGLGKPWKEPGNRKVAFYGRALFGRLGGFLSLVERIGNHDPEDGHRHSKDVPAKFFSHKPTPHTSV